MAQSTRPAKMEPILFTRGVPATEALPAQLIGQCMQAVLEGPEAASVLQYGHNGGYLPLRQLVGDRYGVAEDQVLIGNGSLHLQDMLAAKLVKAGDVVLVEQPSYDRAIKTFRRRGARVIGIPLEQDGVNLEALEQALKKQKPAFMYLVPDFQNPTGITTSAEKREQLVELAERHDFWLIEDVPYRMLRYRGTSVPFLRSISPRRVLTIGSYSKLISPGLRVGYLIGPVTMIEQLQQLAEETVLTPVLPTEAAVVEFYRRGYFTSNLEHLKRLYAPRMQAIIAALKQHLPDVPFAEPEGGFFVSITLPEQVNCANLLRRAQQAGIVLTDGRDFFADPLDDSKKNARLGERFVRLPFCALTPDQIDEGIKRLASLVTK
ncbi:MAG: PLP-dependent aminotransferase family protein [Ktedonobacteraceae bacterium]|nr:PLP-dependent aminotransferase family protein [Chloroflexota bacterium]